MTNFSTGGCDEHLYLELSLKEVIGHGNDPQYPHKVPFIITYFRFTAWCLLIFFQPNLNRRMAAALTVLMYNDQFLK